MHSHLVERAEFGGPLRSEIEEIGADEANVGEAGRFLEAKSRLHARYVRAENQRRGIPLPSLPPPEGKGRTPGRSRARGSEADGPRAAAARSRRSTRRSPASPAPSSPRSRSCIPSTRCSHETSHSFANISKAVPGASTDSCPGRQTHDRKRAGPMERNAYEFGKMTLALPALHATHAGIWLARRRRARRARRAGARRSRAPPKRRTSSSTRRWSGSGSAIPSCAGSTCSSCSPSSIRRASRCRPPAGLSRALGLEPPASEAEAAAALQRDRRAAAGRARRSRLARARGRVDVERDAAPARLGLGAADRRAARAARARRAHAVLAAASNGRKRPSGRRRARSASTRRRGAPSSTG